MFTLEGPTLYWLDATPAGLAEGLPVARGCVDMAHDKSGELR